MTGLVLEVGVCGLGGSSVTSCGCAQEVSPDVKAHFAAKANLVSAAILLSCSYRISGFMPQYYQNNFLPLYVSTWRIICTFDCGFVAVTAPPAHFPPMFVVA